MCDCALPLSYHALKFLVSTNFLVQEYVVPEASKVEVKVSHKFENRRIVIELIGQSHS
jgi:hypothetical protein